VATPNTCPYCPAAQPLIFKTTVKAYVTDLVAFPQPEITEYSVAVMECPACGRSVRASHPDLAENQGGATAHRLGARLHAVTQVLRYAYGLPERKIPGVLELLTGAKISQSAINQTAQRKAGPGTPLDTRYSELKAGIQKASYVHQDDTGWRTHGAAAWLGVYCSSNTVLYTLGPKHTHQEVLDVLGKAFKGVLVTDRYTVYDPAKFAQTQQQKCVAHLIRNAADRPGRTLSAKSEVVQFLLSKRQNGICPYVHKRSSLSLKTPIKWPTQPSPKGTIPSLLFVTTYRRCSATKISSVFITG
jgi:transposase